MDLNKTRKLNNYLGKFPLLGFKSEVNLIALDSSHIIRKGTKKELEAISKRIDYSNHKAFEYLLVFSFSTKEDPTYPEEIINHFKILSVFFQIFKSGSIGIPYCNRYVKKEEENTYSSIGFVSDPRVNYYDEKPYTISRQEIFLLKSMWGKYINLFTSKNNGFQTAVRRFYFSSQRFDIEDKVIDLMIAFEALFLTENVELSFKLSLRVARFLADEYDSSRLYDIMRKAYSLRSKFVHGDGLKPAEEQNNLKNLEIKVLIKDLSEMLQLSIRKYVRDFSKVSVSDFIKSIDDKIISGQ
jgi:Apea-like HEPN